MTDVRWVSGARARALCSRLSTELDMNSELLKRASRKRVQDYRADQLGGHPDQKTIQDAFFWESLMRRQEPQVCFSCINAQFTAHFEYD